MQLSAVRQFILRGSDLAAGLLGSAYRTSVPAVLRALAVLAITYASIRIGKWIEEVLPSQSAVMGFLLDLAVFIPPITLILLLERVAQRFPDSRSAKRMALLVLPFVAFGFVLNSERVLQLTREGFRFALSIGLIASYLLLRSVELTLLALPSRRRDVFDVLKTVAMGLAVVVWAGQSAPKAIVVASLIVVYGSAVLIAARLRGEHLIRAEIFPKIAPDTSAPDLLVLSDTHLGPRPSEPANERLESLLRHPAAQAGSSILLFSGDITNEGLASEWQEFDRIVEPLVGVRRILLLPGNHDLLYGSDKLFRREARFLLRLWRYLPEDVVYESASGLRSVRDFLSSEAPHLLSTAYYGLKVRPTKWNAQDVSPIPLPGSGTATLLEPIYPMWLDDAAHDARIILLNSCHRSALSWIDNAQGQLGRAQLERLSTLLKHTEQKHVVIALHHQVGFPTNAALLNQLPWASRTFQWSAFTLLDREPFLKAISTRPGVAIVHGHKHVAYSARIGDSWILSAPSATRSLEARLAGFPALFGLQLSVGGLYLNDLSGVRQP